jgi:hypothetical protein
MRPRELVLRGFRSYADETTFTFADRSLIGIVGPIGSASPRSSTRSRRPYARPAERDTKSLISQRRILHVSLTFEVEGVTWGCRPSAAKGIGAHAVPRRRWDVEAAGQGEGRHLPDRDVLAWTSDVPSPVPSPRTVRRFLRLRDRSQQGARGVFGFERPDAMRRLPRADLIARSRPLAGEGQRSRGRWDLCHAT